MHAGAPRPARRCARLPVAAVGFDRDLGRRDHVRPAPRGGHDDARVRPSAPVRDRRRELPHRLHRVALRARARERPVAHAPRPDVDRHAALPAEPGFVHHAVRRLAHVVPRRGRLPGAAHDAAAEQWLRDERAATTTASCCSSTSSIRTSRSTRPSRGRRGTTRSGKARADLAAVLDATIEKGAARPSARRGSIRANYGAKLAMIDHWLGRILDALDELGAVGRHRGRPLHRPRPLPRRARRLRQARHAGVRATRAHPAAHRVARRAPRDVSTRSRRTSTCTRRSPTCSASTPAHRTHGRSLVPLIDGEADAVREYALLGVLGRAGPRRRRGHGSTRARPSATTPARRCGRTGGRRCRSTRCPSCACRGPTGAPSSTDMPGSDVPVIRQPFDAGDLLPFWAYGVEAGRAPAARPRRRSVADPRTSPAPPPRRKRSTCCALRSTRSKRPPSSTNASASPDHARFCVSSPPERWANSRKKRMGHGRSRWTSPNSCQR